MNNQKIDEEDEEDETGGGGGADRGGVSDPPSSNTERPSAFPPSSPSNGNGDGDVDGNRTKRYGRSVSGLLSRVLGK